MTGRAARMTGYAMVAFAVVVSIASFTIRIREGATIRAYVGTVDDASVSGDPVNAGLVLAAVGVGLLGTMIVSRLPRNVIGWMFLVTALVMPLGGLSEVYSVWSQARGTPLPAAGLAAAFYESGGAFFWAPLFAMLLLFPDGRPPPGAWRWVVPWTAVVVAGFVLDPLLQLGIADLLWPAHMVALLLSAGALVARFRRSSGIERQQLRWIATSGAFLMVGAVVLFVSGAADDGLGDTQDAWWMLAGPALLVLGFVSIPVAATIAITRYRLYDLDRLVTRASTYGAVVVSVVTIYVVTVLGVGAVIPRARGSDLAVALSTLLAAATFSPLQRRLRIVIDRRFHRQRYDAVVALERLGARLRDEVDETSLVHNVRDTLTSTLQPASVSVWLAR